MLCPIDFDGCRLGYYLEDIAFSFMWLDPQRREMVLNGYQRIRKLTDEDQRTIEAFLIKLRIAGWQRWCGQQAHRKTPFYGRLRDGIVLIAKQCQSYLDGKPFLCQDNEVKWFRNRLTL